jgi:hypothetical protein
MRPAGRASFSRPGRSIVTGVATRPLIVTLQVSAAGSIGAAAVLTKKWPLAVVSA